MTLLSLMRDVADEVGVPRPAIIVGSTDQTARQLLAMANREGRELMKAADWTELQLLHEFTTDGSAEYDLPDDYHRVVVDTEWDDDQSWPLHGPISPQGWRVLKVSVIGAGLVGKRYRIYRSASGTGRKFHLDPSTSTGEDLSFFYISKNWCVSSAGTTRAAWEADDDELLFDDDDVFRLGVIIRYKRAKGLNFASESDEYMQLLSRAKAQNRPARTVRLAGRQQSRLITAENIPETGVGS